jgi:hypothetical protein
MLSGKKEMYPVSLSIEMIVLWSIYALFFWLVVIPLLTLLHELGHAGMALLLSGSSVTVVLGDYHQIESVSRQWQFQAGRLRCVLQPFSGFSGFFLWSREDAPRLSRIAVNLAGPLTSLLVGLLAWWLIALSALESFWLSQIVAGIRTAALLQFLGTIAPLRYPGWMGAYRGHPSDGLRVYHLLTSQSDTKSQ